MRKSLLLAAVIGTFAASNVAIAEEAAPAVESPHSFSYNLGLYSQYIFRGLTQTGEEAALQGGMDYSHSSGFYLGTWASNISWLEDDGLYTNSSLELDIYGGYAAEIGETGIGYNVGVLQYLYPGDSGPAAAANAETTEVYGSLAYEWISAKVSVVVSSGAFGIDDADGTWYAELNANYPIAETGYTLAAHVGRQEFSGSGNDANDYTDYKLGIMKSWDNGVNLGGFYTTTVGGGLGDYVDASNQKLGGDQFTVFVQKTF